MRQGHGDAVVVVGGCRSGRTFKDQLISTVGSLFLISGNPLEPGSMSVADNQGKRRTEGEMNACPCTCTTYVSVGLSCNTVPRSSTRRPQAALRSCQT